MKKMIRENRITKDELLVDETIFSVANGFLGTRGTFVEGYGTDFDYNQTYQNGFYDYYDYFYEENFTGFPQEGHKFVNILDGQKMEFIVKGVPLNISTCEIVSLKREYDLELGMTIRKIHYKTKDNFDFIIIEKRIASVKYRDLIALNIQIETLNYEGELELKSYLQESIKSDNVNIDPRVHDGNAKLIQIKEVIKNEQVINIETSKSNLRLSSKIMHSDSLVYEDYSNKLVGKKTYTINSKTPINITKYIIYTSSLYYPDYKTQNEMLAKQLLEVSFEDIVKSQKAYYEEFWFNSYIKVDSDNDVESLLNYNIFQLNSSGGESSVHNISAKGLSGEGYEGHYFWDTEIYLVPFFTLTNPEKAKNLLMYRYNNLDKSRKEAENLGYTSGAKIPWRTINGHESSPYYPAGSAQFHINSDVSYAVIKYFETTKDLDFMLNYGFEILLETARFLAEATNFANGEYHLNSVTGPDEYTTVVDDNYYTNQMLKYHFDYTYYFYNKYTDQLSTKIKKLSVTKNEIDKIYEISKNIHLPFDEKLNIFAQDKSFLNKKILDLSTVPKEKFPLLLNFHPLYLYKHQVLKQADTVLAMVLLDFEDQNILRDSFNYYEPITTHDSSLSKCIYSIAAFKLNDLDMGCKYFEEVLQTDYYNTHKNTDQGLHVANMGGSYIGFIYGILGLTIHDKYISVNPKTTSKIKGYELKIKYQGNHIIFKVSNSLEITTKSKITFMINGKKQLVNGIYKQDL